MEPDYTDLLRDHGTITCSLDPVTHDVRAEVFGYCGRGETVHAALRDLDAVINRDRAARAKLDELAQQADDAGPDEDGAVRDMLDD